MPAATDEILAEVHRLLAERAGMSADALGVGHIAHAVQKRASVGGDASPQNYLRRLMADADAFQELLEDLLVAETWFFRDTTAFKFLARRLETIVSLRQGAVRVLSVGCSTGEEVYSLAMALRGAGVERERLCIVGTDVSRRSLEAARSGIFPQRSFRDRAPWSDALCSQWLEDAGASRCVREELRTGIEFRWANLAQSGFLEDEPPFDIVFCRNVLIYFHDAARVAAVGRLRRLVSLEGFLCGAPAEARIFADSGMKSLGSECPFAFRHDDPAERAATPAVPRPAAIPRPAAAKPAAARGVSAVRTVPRPAPPSAVADSSRSAQAILDAAKQAADDGRLEEADALCRQALAREPASAAAHYLSGVIQQALGAADEARRSLEKVLYLDPKHYEALLQMMLLAEQRGDRQGAANYRRRAQSAARPEAE